MVSSLKLRTSIVMTNCCNVGRKKLKFVYIFIKWKKIHKLIGHAYRPCSFEVFSRGYFELSRITWCAFESALIKTVGLFPLLSETKQG